MPDAAANRRVFVLGNPDKDGVHDAIADVCAFAEPRCDLVGSTLGLDTTAAAHAHAEFIVVLGGDGSLLAVSRSLGRNQIPLIGVNFGKLGFLAEFTVAEFKTAFDTLMRCDDFVSDRMILHARVLRRDKTCFESLAVNDCVVEAGAPFRMIELAVNINDARLTNIGGDGLIVCTPVGSTAYNLAAGGPIMQGGVMGITLTPLCPHSLTHRPLVVEHEAEIQIVVVRANPGTTLLIDGQINATLEPQDRIVINRFSANLALVRNPANPKWHSLVTKLHWGQSHFNK